MHQRKCRAFTCRHVSLRAVPCSRLGAVAWDRVHLHTPRHAWRASCTRPAHALKHVLLTTCTCSAHALHQTRPTHTAHTPLHTRLHTPLHPPLHTTCTRPAYYLHTAALQAVRTHERPAHDATPAHSLHTPCAKCARACARCSTAHATIRVGSPAFLHTLGEVLRFGVRVHSWCRVHVKHKRTIHDAQYWRSVPLDVGLNLRLLLATEMAARDGVFKATSARTVPTTSTHLLSSCLPSAAVPQRPVTDEHLSLLRDYDGRLRALLTLGAHSQIAPDWNDAIKFTPCQLLNAVQQVSANLSAPFPGHHGGLAIGLSLPDGTSFTSSVCSRRPNSPAAYSAPDLGM